MIASRGASDFLRNALTSIARCGIDMAVVRVGAPEDQVEDIARITARFGASTACLATSAGHPSDGYELFGTTEFNRFMVHKYPLVRALLNEGRHVVYADVDVAWLRNPLPYLEAILAHYCGAAQTEALPVFPPSYCTGFFAFAPGTLSEKILDIQIEQLLTVAADGYSISDQQLFCKIMEEEPEFLGAVFPLPEGPFPNGLLERSVPVQGHNRGILESVLKPYIFHANWTIGAANKRALLKRANCWFVDGPLDVKASEAARQAIPPGIVS